MVGGIVTVRGIDVSGYIPDWPQWGLQFGMCKATEGAPGEAWDFDEPAFDANWAGMKRAGIRRFAYHYAHPSADPAAQAAFLTRVVRAAGLEKGDNFVLDLESADGLPPIRVSFWAYVFCSEINRLNPGHRVLVYTYPWFAEQGYCAKLGNWALWIANYNVPRPAVPLPWRRWQFWQYTGGLDTDHDVFSGTEAELLAWTASSG